jgi:urea carboxylase
MLAREAASIEEFRRRQSAAFAEERAAWAAAGEFMPRDDIAAEPLEVDYTPPEGGTVIGAPMTASVWKVNVEVGDEVEAGQALVVIEAMKTETSVLSPCHGTVIDIVAVRGDQVSMGAPLVVVRPA